MFRVTDRYFYALAVNGAQRGHVLEFFDSWTKVERITECLRQRYQAEVVFLGTRKLFVCYRPTREYSLEPHEHPIVPEEFCQVTEYKLETSEFIDLILDLSKEDYDKIAAESFWVDERQMHYSPTGTMGDKL